MIAVMCRLWYREFPWINERFDERDGIGEMLKRFDAENRGFGRGWSLRMCSGLDIIFMLFEIFEEF